MLRTDRSGETGLVLPYLAHREQESIMVIIIITADGGSFDM